MAPDSTTSKELSKRRKGNLPKKPYKDFPLSPHSRGYWYKTIDGKMHYFGRWGRMDGGKFVRFEGEEYEAEWKAAKALYDKQSDDFKTGTIRTMDKPNCGGKTTVAVLCFKFMQERQKDLEAGKIGQPMLKEYMSLCQTILSVFGESKVVESLGPADFQTLRREFESRLGANRLANTITWTKTIFAFAYDMELIPAPIRCLSRTNKIFQPPTKREKRREEAAKPKRLLTPAECKLLLRTAPAPLKAWILLGLNCGFGPMDCAQLPIDRIDFKNKVIDWPRPKTGIDRRVFLWPETIAAIKEAIAKRPTPKHDDAKGLVFVTGIGRSFVGSKTGKANQISVQVRSLMIDAGVHQDGFGGYTFRSVFRTIADETKDGPAIDFIMGHADDSMGARYRQEISDKRLQAVSDHVRGWLFGKTPRKTK